MIEENLVWVSRDRLNRLLEDAKHLTGTPEPFVEVLSYGETNVQRGCLLKLYSQQGVQEYWIVNKGLYQVQVYRRENAILPLV